MPAARLQAAGNVDVIRPMPRRQPFHALDTGYVSLQMAHRVVFKPGIIQPFLRWFVWLFVCIQFFGGNALDLLSGRDTTQRRAVRLREALESGGVSFAKLAQQLSLRADFLPYAYCVELSKMLDRAKPFPTAEAIAIIQRSLGRPLNEIFSTFDPEPIGSASLSCVYQATLNSGDRVAVKVRRPGIGRLLASDLRAIDWLLVLAETFTLLRPGSTSQFRQDLRDILMGELNFRAEARYTEMFRLRAQTDVVTAPRVYFQYCSDEVLVTELMSGVWMRELMTAVDRNDQEFLSNARSAGIDPGVVGRRLLEIGNRMIYENTFFHADPHPANLIVLPDSRICFIDFGAVAGVSAQNRGSLRETQYHMKNYDVERVVQTSARFASFPPMDVDAVNEAMAGIWADWILAVRSTDAEWWERSSAANWVRYINAAGEHQMPMNAEIIQLSRATLLYDSIVMRLDKDVDIIKENEVYAQKAAKDARRRVSRSVRNSLSRPIHTDFVRIEQLSDMVTQFAFSFQRRVEDPIPLLRSVTGKIASVFSILLRIGYLALLGSVLAVTSDEVAARLFGYTIVWSSMVNTLMSNRSLQLILLIVAILLVRMVLVRLNDPDMTR
jgi:predicted unusual protein kinase regulating ubiquinone biosynthesis (AarF/ABC1/UbiB family)